MRRLATTKDNCQDYIVGVKEVNSDTPQETGEAAHLGP
jgi:hypothetical protein